MPGCRTINNNISSLSVGFAVSGKTAEVNIEILQANLQVQAIKLLFGYPAKFNLLIQTSLSQCSLILFNKSDVISLYWI